MTAITRIAWKEFTESRWLLYAGAAVLIVLPLLQAAQWYSSWNGQWSISAGIGDALWGLGPFFVGVCGLAAASRDLRAGESALWRHLPVRPTLFIGAKFLTGFLFAFAVILLALAIDLAVSFAVGHRVSLLGANADNDAIRATLQNLAFHLPLLALVYAVAFAFGALVAQIMVAFLLTATVGGLLYFVPLLVPGLERFSIFNLMAEPPFWLFENPAAARYYSGSTLLETPLFGYWVVYAEPIPWLWGVGLASAALVAAIGIVAGARGMRGRVTFSHAAWSLTLVGLALFAIAGVQVGSNLTPVAILPLTADSSRVATQLHLGQSRGISLTSPARRGVIYPQQGGQFLHPLSLTNEATDAALGPAAIEAGFFTPYFDDHDSGPLAWSPDRPHVAFAIRETHEGNGGQRRRTGAWLVAADLTPDAADPLLSELDLRTLMPETVQNRYQLTNLHLDGNRLYLLNLHRDIEAGPAEHRHRTAEIIALDVSDAAAITVADRWPVRGFQGGWDSHSGSSVAIELPDIPGMPREQRLALRKHLAQSYALSMLEGDLFIEFDRDQGLRVYRLASATDTRLTYEIVGRRPHTPLESMIGLSPHGYAFGGGILAVLTASPGSGMVAFDLRDPADPKKLGHYVAPTETIRSIATTPDGRIVLGGFDLHVFDPRAW